jgi:hypothetical protein
MATLTVFADRAQGTKYGIDTEGRTIASRNFLVRINDYADLTTSDRVALILLDSRIPKYGNYLFTSTVDGLTNPIVKTIDVQQERENEPSIFKVAIEYGYSDTDNPDSETTDDIEDPRERYPWEERPEVDISMTTKDYTRDLHYFVSTYKKADVASAMTDDDPPASDTMSGKLTEFRNTAGDLLKDIPAVPNPVYTITISFNALEGDVKAQELVHDWDLYKCTLNRTSFSINVVGTPITAKIGHVLVQGLSAPMMKHTVTKSWKPGKKHPFDKKNSKGNTVYNNTNKEVSVSHHYPYNKITLTFELNPMGYSQYLLDVGFRQKLTDGKFGIIMRDKSAVTEPAKLDGEGKKLADDSEEAFYQKYQTYEYSDIAGMIELIPWERTDNSGTAEILKEVQ